MRWRFRLYGQLYNCQTRCHRSWLKNTKDTVMNCSKCGYNMDAWDSVCPRCKGQGIDKPAPAATPAQSAPRPATPQKAAPQARTPSYDEPEDEDNWWKLLGGGVLMWGFAGFFYWEVTRAETLGALMRMKWYIAMAYRAGGKWPIVSVFGVLGLICVILGIVEFRKMLANQK